MLEALCDDPTNLCVGEHHFGSIAAPVVPPVHHVRCAHTWGHRDDEVPKAGSGCRGDLSHSYRERRIDQGARYLVDTLGQSVQLDRMREEAPSCLLLGDTDDKLTTVDSEACDVSSELLVRT